MKFSVIVSVPIPVHAQYPCALSGQSGPAHSMQVIKYYADNNHVLFAIVAAQP